MNGARGAALWIRGPAPPLWEAEDPGPGAVEVRRREFAFGRAAARRALRDLGLEPVAIPRRADRTPAFPAGVVGSLSHSRTLAVALVGPADRFAALGVDVEPLEPLQADLAPIVATPTERRRLQGDGSLLCLFAAKEAAFKCWYSAGGARIADFHEFEISLEADGRFAVSSQPAPEVPLRGRWVVAHTHLWAVCSAPVLAEPTSRPRS